jgi:DNA repair protein RecO (recombination protein O)
VAGRTYRTEAVVLRSFRLGEADRVLHLYTLDRGRVGAVAKGIRRTRSRVGGRLEPLSHVELQLHQGRGELQTITTVDLIRSHRESREDSHRLGVALGGAEAMLRLFTEQEANPRAFAALLRFLELAGELEHPSRPTRPALEPLGLAFQLKLLWLSGYQPHLDSCAECGGVSPLVAYLPRAGGAVCGACANGAMPLSPEGLRAIEALLRRPLADAATLGLSERDTREALRVLTASYEEHGGFRLRTASA